MAWRHRRQLSPTGSVAGHSTRGTPGLHAVLGVSFDRLPGTADVSWIVQRSAGREPEHCSRPAGRCCDRLPQRRAAVTGHPGWRRSLCALGVRQEVGREPGATHDLPPRTRGSSQRRHRPGVNRSASPLSTARSAGFIGYTTAAYVFLMLRINVAQELQGSERVLRPPEGA